MNDSALYLNVLLLLPLIASLFIPFTPDGKSARNMAIGFGLGMLAVSLYLLMAFNHTLAGMQFVTYTPWVTTPVSVAYHVGLDVDLPPLPTLDPLCEAGAVAT